MAPQSDVGLTSMRYDVATGTSVGHNFRVFCPLGSLQTHGAKSRFSDCVNCQYTLFITIVVCSPVCLW